jgi:hypothetical protein
MELHLFSQDNGRRPGAPLADFPRAIPGNLLQIRMEKKTSFYTCPPPATS